MDHKIFLSDPGIFKKGKYFFYHNTKERVTDKNTLIKLNGLRVPPAWTNVWYASNKKCHVQVHGIDIGGKKQYILSELWINSSKAGKFNRMKCFVKDINSFKRKIKLKGNEIITKEILLFLLFNLLIDLHIRVGNEIYAEKNSSYGLTTLRQKHLKKIENHYYFIFKGKSKIDHTIKIPLFYNKYFDQLKNVKNSKPLFQINGVLISSEELNMFLKENMGKDYTCKDFRTYSANILFIKSFKNANIHELLNANGVKKIITNCIDHVAELLGHSRNISKKSYISNNLIDYCLTNFDTAKNCSEVELINKIN